MLCWGWVLFVVDGWGCCGLQSVGFVVLDWFWGWAGLVLVGVWKGCGCGGRFLGCCFEEG